jgi:hypothetical protein
MSRSMPRLLGRMIGRLRPNFTILKKEKINDDTLIPPPINDHSLMGWPQ